MQYWIITDTHFNHARLQELGGRPVDADEQIKRNWQRLVAPDDVVIHLGDVIIGKQSQLKGIMEQLPGTKILVRGNHDHEKNSWYIQRGFAFVCDMLVIRDILFSHEPVAVLPSGVRINIHGHFHNNDHRTFEFDVKPHNKVIYIEHEYNPIALEALREMYKE
ncbi:MAG: metallophosphoesterase [Chloroflexota bacterium]|nr:metallophosphoesterase [Chloroflexota bacterium]